MTPEWGDHVWYWNANISLDKNIPRAQWFPGSSPGDPNDYQGHGGEIYHDAIHADEIARGRPAMRNREGSFLWLDNNPGNIAGVPGGPDFGQNPGKFNWHNFLIFSTWAGGYNAIAMLLRLVPAMTENRDRLLGCLKHASVLPVEAVMRVGHAPGRTPE
jgi:hypothetical protein